MGIYAYIRISTEMQNCASQKYEIEKYCEKNGLTVSEWTTESVSGTITVEKRMLGELLERMNEGDVLVCTELSRLGRNMLMIMSILNICSGKGIAIHSIKDHFDLTDSINSKIIAFAFALAAEIERNLISQRTKEALAVKKLEGVRLGRPPGNSKQKVTFCKEYDNIIKMRADGHSITSIAKAYGMHRNTLKHYLDNIKL